MLSVYQQYITRIVFALEALLLILPLSVLLILLALLDVFSFPERAWAVVLFGSPGAISLWYGWRLSFHFLKWGAYSLDNSPERIWRFLHMGALLTALGGLTFFVPWDRVLEIEPSDVLPAPIPELRGLGLALPLLIPYFHLVLERARGASTGMHVGGHVAPSSVPDGVDQ